MRRISYQVISEVYRTIPAITTVKIKPGTRPRIEYDQGKDIIARQMYSEKSNAAVCKEKISQWGPNLLIGPKRTFCQLHVRYLIVLSDSSSIWRPMLSVVDDESMAVT